MFLMFKVVVKCLKNMMLNRYNNIRDLQEKMRLAQKLAINKESSFLNFHPIFMKLGENS